MRLCTLALSPLLERLDLPVERLLRNADDLLEIRLKRSKGVWRWRWCHGHDSTPAAAQRRAVVEGETLSHPEPGPRSRPEQHNHDPVAAAEAGCSPR